MAIAPLYQRFVDDELALAPQLVSRVAAGTIQLLGPSKDAAVGGDRVHDGDVVTALERQLPLYEKTFVDSLRTQVAEGLGHERGADMGDAKEGSLGLELMDESRVEV